MYSLKNGLAFLLKKHANPLSEEPINNTIIIWHKIVSQ
ncbi:hypothetical protein KKH3_14520 [Pectobacterium actinidiae]|nr:hypothetical protein KKH3_14520 [Pectobacterium actinidiae]